MWVVPVSVPCHWPCDLPVSGVGVWHRAGTPHSSTKVVHRDSLWGRRLHRALARISLPFRGRGGTEIDGEGGILLICHEHEARGGGVAGTRILRLKRLRSVTEAPALAEKERAFCQFLFREKKDEEVCLSES